MKKLGKRKLGKENAAPQVLSRSLLENLLGDNINQVAGRRSDVGKRSLCLVDTDDSIDDGEINNDEREKEELRREEEERAEREGAAAARAKPTGLDILATLSKEELDQHYSKCIELCNKNKVNVKNAFKLQLIDYMKLIVSNRSTNSDNLTLMSCTLGASAKIYGVRVDKVYTDMVKILSGKGSEIEKEESDEENVTNEDDVADADAVKSKKKGKSDSSDEEDDDKEIYMEAMLMTEAQLNKSKGGDGEPQERATLPRGLDYFLECRQLDPDGRFSLNPPVFSNLEIEKTNDNSTIMIDVPHHTGNFERLDPNEYIKDYKNLCKCFSIMNEEDGGENSLEAINSSFTFDPSTNISESIRFETEDNDLDFGEGVAADSWGPDYDEDEDPPMPDLSNGLKSGQVSMNQPRSFTAETMVKLVSAKAGDYSFFDNSRIDFWAGPRHWTIKPPKAGERIKKSGVEQLKTKKTGKKSCSLNFAYDNLQDVKKYYADMVNAVLARKTILTWNTRRYKIPQDIAWSQKQLLSLMKNEQLMYLKKDSSTNMICPSDLRNEEEEAMLTPDDFGVEADNDVDDDDLVDGDLTEPIRDRSLSPLENHSFDQLPHGSNSNGELELLPAPQKVNKISLKYAKAPKRIDIKQLKSVMWNSLDLETQPKGKEVKFSEVYSTLPEKLPSEEASELSFPIAFMALLHMANEKTLSITATEDNQDLNVTLG